MTQVDLSGYTDRIQVDMTTRKIADAGRAGTQYDHKAVRKVFEVDRHLNGVDLAEKLASIHWACGMNGGVYPVTEWDTQSVEGKILIKWELLQEYTQSAVLAYAIHFYGLEGDEYGYHASTRIARDVLPPTLVMTDHSNKTGDPAAIEQLAKSIVPADWAQNDPDAKDYIKNRPSFYEDTVLECETTVNTDISGKDTISHEDVGNLLYRVLDEVIPEGECEVELVYKTLLGSNEVSLWSRKRINYIDNGICNILIGKATGGSFNIYFVNKDGATVFSPELNTTFTFKKGVYVDAPDTLSRDDIKYVKIKIREAKAIDKKYLPDDCNFVITLDFSNMLPEGIIQELKDYLSVDPINRIKTVKIISKVREGNVALWTEYKILSYLQEGDDFVIRFQSSVAIMGESTGKYDFSYYRVYTLSSDGTVAEEQVVYPVAFYGKMPSSATDIGKCLVYAGYGEWKTKELPDVTPFVVKFSVAGGMYSDKTVKEIYDAYTAGRRIVGIYASRTLLVLTECTMSGNKYSISFLWSYTDQDDPHAGGVLYLTDASATAKSWYWSSRNPLPTVSASDAGKFLRVSSTGAWAAETVPNAEEVSF